MAIRYFPKKRFFFRIYVCTFYTNRATYVFVAKLSLTSFVLKRIITFLSTQSMIFLRVKRKPGYFFVLIGKDDILIISRSSEIHGCKRIPNNVLF